MAKLEVRGIEELAKELDAIGQSTGEMATAMLQAGAQVLVNAWHSVILKRQHIETRDMMRGVKATKPRVNKDGVLGVDVYPHGKDRKGVRNAEKAFVLHYGWKNRAGDHFVDEVEQEASDGVVDAMRQSANRYMRRRKG